MSSAANMRSNSQLATPERSNGEGNGPTEYSHHAQKSNTSTNPLHPSKPGHWRLVYSKALITAEVLQAHYDGSGTDDDPFVVDFLKNDPRNPMAFPAAKKWGITVVVALATLAVAFVSSAYSGAITQVIAEFDLSTEVATLGTSLFVLGFAFGPLIWAPLSELYGRQVLFVGTYGMLTLFNGALIASRNVTTICVLRFLAGAFGSSPLTNAGGVIADMFSARERGIATAFFAAAPFMGPAIGPIVGGFVGETVGWRWVAGVMTIFTGVVWIMGALCVPETYAPVLLSRRAKELSKRTGKVYKSRLESGPKARNTNPKDAFKVALSRPWALLFLEPIVLLLTIFLAILYGTLYMLFGAFPIVFQEVRGWSQGVGGLAFIGVAVGFLLAVGLIIAMNRRYEKLEDACVAKGELSAPPEARLIPCLIGAILTPIGMFWFAWTNYPSIHWIVCIIGSVPFGAGCLLVFVSITNYLIDAYTVYAASVLAANAVVRSLFGFSFPLFTTYMYENLSIHWASSVPAFLALACVPFPFLFYRYGATIRTHCRYSQEAMEVFKQLKYSENIDERADSESDKELEKDVEKGHEQAYTGQFGDLSKTSTKKSTSSLRNTHSHGREVLERARSYASNF